MIKTNPFLQAFSLSLLLLTAFPRLQAQGFDPPVSNPFGLGATGSFNSPAVADLDGDGDGDVLSGFGSGDFAYFQNKGSAKTPFFAGNEINPFGLSALPGNSNPALVDLDDDGDFDLFCGSSNGLYYFENTGSPAVPNFASPVQAPFSIVPPQGVNIPEFADLDLDGDFDLFLAAADGNIYYFENTGDAGNPAFSAPLKNPFGLKGVGAAAALAFDRDRLNLQFRLLICEQDTGHFYAYIEFITGLFDFFGKDPGHLTALGAGLRPVFYDLNGDKANDLLTGNADGEFHLFSGVRPLGLAAQPQDEVQIYPNPAGRLLHIENAAGSRIEVLDTRGKMILQSTVQSSQEAFRLDAIPAGLYLIRICTEGKSDYILKILRL